MPEGEQTLRPVGEQTEAPGAQARLVLVASTTLGSSRGLAGGDGKAVGPGAGPGGVHEVQSTIAHDLRSCSVVRPRPARGSEVRGARGSKMTGGILA